MVLNSSFFLKKIFLACRQCCIVFSFSFYLQYKLQFGFDFSDTLISNRSTFVVTGLYILHCWLSTLQCCISCHVLERKGIQSLQRKSTHELSFWCPVRSVIITKINRKLVNDTNQTPAGDHMVCLSDIASSSGPRCQQLCTIMPWICSLVCSCMKWMVQRGLPTN